MTTAQDQQSRALPAGVEPVAQVEISVPHLRSIVVKMIPGAEVPATGTQLYTAAQVLAMGRVPPGWQAVPVEPTVEQINAAHNRGFFRPLAIPLYDAMLAAAPRPPAAKETP